MFVGTRLIATLVLMLSACDHHSNVTIANTTVPSVDPVAVTQTTLLVPDSQGP